MKEIDIEIGAKFKELVFTDKRYVIAMGGRGSSKSTHATLKVLFKSFEPKYNHIVYVNKEKAHIKAQQFQTFKMVATQYGIYDQFKWYNGDYRIENIRTGTIFTPLGMDDPEKTKGIADPTVIYWDEITKGNQNDFTTLNALLRTPKNKHQFIMCFNPVSERHWLRDYFFDKEDPYKINEDFAAETYFSHSTFKDNPFINQKEYERTLLLNSGGSQSRLECDMYGRWGVEQIQNPAIRNFNESRHVGKAVRNPSYPLIFSVDFNVSPLVAIVCQEYKDPHHKIRVLEEIIIENGNTQDLINVIKSKYSLETLSRALFTGDASGQNKTTASAFSNFQQLDRAFRLNKRLIIPKSNPSVIDTLDLCEYIFGLHPDLIIDESCKVLIFELLYTERNETGLVKKNRTKQEERADALDCMRYFANTFFKLMRSIIQTPAYYGIK
jgi:PBSX family phage terminase large subunit